MNKIINENHIKDIVKKEGLELLVVSYGGSASNTLVKILEKNNLKCTTNIWHIILCHFPHYIDIDIPIIYIYDNPIKSFLSMKKRGFGYWAVNQMKLSNNKNIQLSDENLIKLMINQFNNWTNIKRDNLLVIKTSDLFKNIIISKLEKFLKKKIFYFPIPFKKPNITIENIENFKRTKLAKKYIVKIDKINNFK